MVEALQVGSQGSFLPYGMNLARFICQYMPKTFQIVLESLDLGQILDGLRAREESWRNTAVCLRDDYFPNEAFVCEECSDAKEADKIANYYRRIIAELERQIEKQGGW